MLEPFARRNGSLATSWSLCSEPGYLCFRPAFGGDFGLCAGERGCSLWAGVENAQVPGCRVLLAYCRSCWSPGSRPDWQTSFRFLTLLCSTGHVISCGSGDTWVSPAHSPLHSSRDWNALIELESLDLISRCKVDYLSLSWPAVWVWLLFALQLFPQAELRGF